MFTQALVFYDFTFLGGIEFFMSMHDTTTCMLSLNVTFLLLHRGKVKEFSHLTFC